MRSNTFSDDATIVAVATPPGKGGVGIIRLSGPQALKIGLRVFRFGDELAERKRVESHRMYYGWVCRDAGKRSPHDSTSDILHSRIDNGYLVYFKAPDSYTGEDVVELQLHGSPRVLEQVVALCLHVPPFPSSALRTSSKGGIRLAEPGEFTRRAFVNGKLDLAQAEAVADLIEAKTATSALLASRHLGGELGTKLLTLRKRLLALVSLIAGNVNFPEDDLPAVKIRQLQKELAKIISEITDLTSNSRYAWIYRDGLHVAIIGLPNAGKSSLFNALLARDRAIVSEISGTTRDVIEETMDVQGVPVVLSDTAGITRTDDQLEKMSMERSIKTIRQADMLLLVLDAAKPSASGTSFFQALDPAVRALVENKPMMRVYNKLDATTKYQPRVWKQDEAWVSAKTGKHIDRLAKQLVRGYLESGLEQGSLLVTSVRQQHKLDEVKQALLEGLSALTSRRELDIISLDLERAVAALGEILGIETEEEIVQEIFSRFCIGK
ncbi:MAG TPA: tRNA uridine-5-carboxymethylaminomethyl(34) synthesis GTPase MnmE [bacterium]|nr:tRNA uridine-5-carboxymethylaminomethyl(34) synthesis GTPase MnmE [bacterium]